MKPRCLQHEANGAADWDELHRRLSRVREHIDRLTAPDHAAQQRQLRERAAVLACEAANASADEPTGNSLEVLEFQLAGECYALEASYIFQVTAFSPLTYVPGVPDYVVGIIAAQPDVLSVVDLRTLLRLPLCSLSEPSAIIVLKHGAMEFGVIAEKILGTARYRIDDIEEGLRHFTGASLRYLKGVTSGRTAVLDAAGLLSDPELVIDAA